MTLGNHLLYWIGFFNVASAYYVIQLGRAVLISVVMLAVILVLRKTLFKNAIFLRGTCWGILLLAPFMGRLKCIYETRLGVRTLFCWQIICAEYRWIPAVYVAGMVCIGVWIFRRRSHLKKEVKGLKKMELCGMKVAVSELAVSPFTTGLFHSVIVVPRVMIESLSCEELEMILLHERVHIQLGHLWCFLLWDILRVTLWANPFLHICTKWFQEDLEEFCDMVTIQKGQQTAYAYGRLLLKSILMLKNENKGLKPSATFAGERQYISVRQRMERVAAFKPYNRLRALAFMTGCGVFLITAFTAIMHFSYPRYTEYDDVQIYNKTGTQVLVKDSVALRDTVRIEEDTVYIDKRKLDCIFEKQNVDTDVFFLYFGGYSKIPGVGGGGDGIFVEYREQEGNFVLPYVSNRSDLRVWLFKYL